MCKNHLHEKFDERLPRLWACIASLDRENETQTSSNFPPLSDPEGQTGPNPSFAVALVPEGGKDTPHRLRNRLWDVCCQR